MKDIVVIAHDIRSTHNVGSLLRTAEGLGVGKVYLTGYTPYPLKPDDDRLPHLAQKITKQIDKTGLGAADLLAWEQSDAIEPIIGKLKSQGYELVALEQTKQSIPLQDYQTPDKVAVLLGREVEGIDSEILKQIPIHVEIPMFGKKESFNVVQAAAMALYHCKFH